MLSTLAFFAFQADDSTTPSKINAAYPEHLTGAYTGGFGENTCHSCHFDYDLNYEKGKFMVKGIPSKLLPDHRYTFEIVLKRDQIKKGGFQMTSRFVDGSQAGEFENAEKSGISFTMQVPDSVQYIQHSSEGSTVSFYQSQYSDYEDSEIKWNVIWRSPTQLTDSIIFNVAANAANGDDSEFGDWIYVKEYKAY